MGQFNGMTFTVAGLQLETKAQTGVAIHFTKVMLGDGQLQQGQLLSALTELINPKLNLPIIVNDVTGTGTAHLQTVLKNEGLVVGFFAREIGIYANDPDAGEILYAVANSGNTADYIPAGGGADVVELIMEVVTTVGQAEHVTAEINTSLLFATVQALMNHENADNPHPQFLRLGAVVTDCSSVIVQQSDPKTINPMGFDDLKRKVLGGSGEDILIMQGEITTLIRFNEEVALQREADGLTPGWTTALAENFVVCDHVDLFSCNVTACIAGDDSIDLDTLKDILTGSWYTISDGVSQELIQVKSVNKSGTTLRILAFQDLQYSYVSGKTKLYRSTAQILSGSALGAGDQRTKTWAPAISFVGVSGNVPQAAVLDTSLTNQALTVTGDGTFTADGFFTLR